MKIDMVQQFFVWFSYITQYAFIVFRNFGRRQPLVKGCGLFFAAFVQVVTNYRPRYKTRRYTLCNSDWKKLIGLLFYIYIPVNIKREDRNKKAWTYFFFLISKWQYCKAGRKKVTSLSFLLGIMRNNNLKVLSLVNDDETARLPPQPPAPPSPPRGGPFKLLELDDNCVPVFVLMRPCVSSSFQVW
jgi:hypothetical protein